MDMKKIEELAITPRTDLSIVEKAYSKPLLGFLRKSAVASWEESAANAPIVFLGIVQAANALYERGEDTYGYAAAVFSTDPKKARDAKFVKDLANELAKIRDMEKPSKEFEAIHAALNDTESMFDTLEIPMSITDGAKAYLTHQGVDRVKEVEGERLTDDSILVAYYVNDNGFEHYTPLLPVELYK